MLLAELTILPWHWGAFVTAVLVLLALDLGIFHKKAHVVRTGEALGWTLCWASLALGFAGLLYKFVGEDKAARFVTGYIVELSLSMDNVFVIAVIFRYFQVPSQLQHRVLFWGILGALAMRGLMIWGGVALVVRFSWLLHVLGAFLILTGIRMVFADSGSVDPERNPIIRLARRIFPVSSEFHGQKFTISGPAGRMLTPLAIVLIMVESTDLVFALDSIPAIFGITQDAFVIFTSNIFAILGLRSLYFVLASAIQYFTYLKYGLSIVLIFIGFKMVGRHWVEIPTNVSLSIVAGIIVLSIVVSILLTRGRRKQGG